MTFAATQTPDGAIHVQNTVGAFLGQHHVHSLEGFERWKKSVKNPDSISIGEGACDCKLKPGFIRECNGTTWFNALFGEKRPAAVDSVVNFVPPPPIPKQPETSPEPVARAEKPKGKKERLPQVKGAKGEKMKYTATATVEGKKQTHEFEHDKASPWKIKAFAANKFFAALVKDKKPLDVWKAIKIDPLRVKAERKAKAKKSGKKAEAKKD